MTKKFYVTTPIYYVNDPASRFAPSGARRGDD